MSADRHPRPQAAESSIRRRRAHRAAQILHETYGSPRHSNKEDPLDELVFIILSQMTTHHSFNRVFTRLKEAAPSWDHVLDLRIATLTALIRDAGLSSLKAPRIRAVLERLRAEFGTATLDPVRSLSDEAVEAYLTTFPGVGIKTARCVMMYSLDRQVLPVDTHVWRIARRLGLVSDRIPYTHVHRELDLVVRPADRYSLHVNALALGRDVCLPRRPRCDSCALRRLCPSASPNKRQVSGS